MSSWASPPPMMMLLLVNGFSPTELSASLGSLKSQTKNLGTHNQREKYWNSYQDIQKDITKYSNIDVDGGKLYGLIKYYRSSEDNDVSRESRTEFEVFSKRQKALVNMTRCLMGRHIKLLVDENDEAGSGKEFFMPWFGDEAQAAYDDITGGEECISIDSDRGVFVSTKIKRKNCCGSTNSIKSVDALLEYVQGLQPDKLLQSVSWEDHQPPTVNSYNLILTGVWPTTITHHLPETIGHTASTSVHELYEIFEKRRNTFYIDQAEALIQKMLTEIAKNNAENSSSVHTGSMKDLACAKRNALLKKVYIDASKTKFILNAKAEGGFECIVVHCRQGEDVGLFEEYGGVVFETFYKLDLSIYG